MTDLLKDYTLHSGGALGADHRWSVTGERYGLVNSRHYWHGSKTPYGNTQVSEAELQEGWEAVLLANKTLKRKPEQYRSLLSRNWLQVKHSEAVYAVSSLRTEREVNGGTGWAVQMAIDDYRDVYVFDQVKCKWYTYDYKKELFTVCYAPVLTQHFAGIGTRELNAHGEAAILAAYVITAHRLQNPLQSK